MTIHLTSVAKVDGRVAAAMLLKLFEKEQFFIYWFSEIDNPSFSIYVLLLFNFGEVLPI